MIFETQFSGIVKTPETRPIRRVQASNKKQQHWN
jgi:hypothetical protein